MARSSGGAAMGASNGDSSEKHGSYQSRSSAVLSPIPEHQPRDLEEAEATYGNRANEDLICELPSHSPVVWRADTTLAELPGTG